MAMPSGTKTYLTLEALNANGNPFHVDADSRRDAIHTSAMGKILLTHDSHLLRRLRRNCLIDPQLEGELEQIRRDGFAIHRQGSVEGLNCMAIPLRVKG